MPISHTVIPTATAVLWVYSLFGAANRSGAIKEALSIAGLCLFSSQQKIPVFTTLLSWAVTVIPISLVFCVGVTYTGLERPVLLEKRLPGESCLQSEPVFFLCKTNHTRLFPKRHSFAYPVLEVGIPLSFKGSVGRLFSFNNGHISHGAGEKRWSLFGIDSRDYLRRGNEPLEDKLRDFLRENDLDLDNYPIVYLVTAPRFLGYQFNPVSFWYLKDKDSFLRLVVVEVNNTFDERHMYILRPSRPPIDSTAPPEGEKQTAMSGDFLKTFHVSPFNDRTGKYQVLTRDPLSGREDSKGLVNTVITLYDDSGKKKLIAALRSTKPPVFVSDLSTSIVASLFFVISYGWSGLITFPRIVWEAAKLFGVKKLKVYLRPEVKGSTISRNATAFEIQLERYFRQYLRSSVNDYDRPIRVRYSTAGIGGLPQNEVIQSTPKRVSVDMVVEEAYLTVFSPHFYIIWAASKSIQQALISEMLSKTEEKRSIEVSDQKLFISLLDGPDSAEAGKDEKYPSQRLTWGFIGGLRGLIICPSLNTATVQRSVSGPSFPSAIDRRIFLLSGVDQRAYGRCVMQALLTKTIGFGDGKLLRGYDLAIRGALIYLSWRGIVKDEGLKSLSALGGLALWRIFKGFF